MKLKAVVIGAGIGGLAAARALALRGADVTVLEQAPEIREIGAGVQISANGRAVLRGLGLESAILGTGAVRAGRVSLRDAAGPELLGLDLGRRGTGDGTGRGQLCLHRADLIRVMAAAAIEAGAKLRLLQQAESVLDGARPEVMLANGARVRADLVVGADGWRSRARVALNGEAAPVFTGQVAWRAVIPEPGFGLAGEELSGVEAAATFADCPGRPPIRQGGATGCGAARGPSGSPGTDDAHGTLGGDPHAECHRAEYHRGSDLSAFDGTQSFAGAAELGASPSEVQLYMGPHRHLVTYPLRGGQWRNVVAVETGQDWTAEGWSEAGDPARLRAAFADFGAAPRALLDRVGKVHKWGLFRHKVAQRWHGEATVLVGDAAHPMLPFLGQGANLALEDAWTLAALLDRGDSLASALAAYQADRRDRAVRVAAAAARAAWKYHLAFPPLRRTAHLVLRLSGRFAPGAMMRQFDWIHDVDVTGGEIISPSGTTCGAGPGS